MGGTVAAGRQELSEVAHAKNDGRWHTKIKKAAIPWVRGTNLDSLRFKFLVIVNAQDAR
jgi:hypothetical protein